MHLLYSKIVNYEHNTGFVDFKNIVIQIKLCQTSHQYGTVSTKKNQKLN